MLLGDSLNLKSINNKAGNMMVLISDNRVSKIRCIEKKEKIVSLQNVHNKIYIDETRKQITNKSDFFCYARESVVERLIIAANNLPDGYQFLIKEAYRSPLQQIESFNEYLAYYKAQNPLKTDDEIYEMTSQYVAPVNVSGHPTGGAIDLTLLKDELVLDMGSEYNDVPIEPENLTYLHSAYISDEARTNRETLIVCMEKSGFVNYPPEWWHWSYGDKYWAFLKQCDALYSAIDENEIR